MEAPSAPGSLSEVIETNEEQQKITNLMARGGERDRRRSKKETGWGKEEEEQGERREVKEEGGLHEVQGLRRM